VPRRVIAFRQQLLGLDASFRFRFKSQYVKGERREGKDWDSRMIIARNKGVQEIEPICKRLFVGLIYSSTTGIGAR